MICSLWQQAVGVCDCIGAILCGLQRTPDVVIVFSVLNEALGNRHAILKIVVISVHKDKSLIFNQPAVLAEQIELRFVAVAGGFNLLQASHHDVVVTKIVSFSINVEESSEHSLACPVVLHALFGLIPGALDQNTVVLESVLMAADCLNASHCVIIWAEIVILRINLSPASQRRTKCNVHQSGTVVIKTGIFGATFADTIIAKIIIESIDDLHSSQLHAVNIVAVFDPAFRRNAVHVELIIGIFTVEKLAAGRALENTVDNLIVVRNRGKFSAPCDNCAADRAVGSA